MSQPLLSGDLHTVRQALRAGQSQAPEILAQAALAAQSEACRHVFMPGSPPNPPETLKSTPPGGSGLPLAGIPVSIKDLFDVAGQVTAAGSKVLTSNAPAQADCPAVARLRAAAGDAVEPTARHVDPVVPLNERNTPASFGSPQSLTMDFSVEDRAPEALLNEILWRSIRGAHATMPPPRRSLFVSPASRSADADDDEQEQ